MIVCTCLLSCKNKQRPEIPKQAKPQAGVILRAEHSADKPSVLDTVFYDVIEIESEDMLAKGDSIILTKTIPPDIKTPVIYISPRVPLKILPWIYPQFERKIVITPNWVYFQEVAKSAPPGGCAEPCASVVIYEFKKEGNKMMKDSTVMMCSYPEIHARK